MSPKDDAEMRLNVISGSWMHSTSNGTAPASTTCCDNSVYVIIDKFPVSGVL